MPDGMHARLETLLSTQGYVDIGPLLPPDDLIWSWRPFIAHIGSRDGPEVFVPMERATAGANLPSMPADQTAGSARDEVRR